MPSKTIIAKDGQYVIYLDNAATTAVSRTVLDAMMPYFSREFGNPNSVHRAGSRAEWAVMQARARMAHVLNCDPRQVEFTSGGTESDNQALLTGALKGVQTGKRHIVSSSIEHPAVLRMLDRLQEHGFEVTLAAPDADGVVSADTIERAIRPDTCLVSLMWVNNEIGSVQPVAQVAAQCRARGILFHTDAVQAVGMLPLDCALLGADLISISAHKFHGPKGVGALVVRDGLEPVSLLVGGEQERGHRAGTVNVPGVVGMSAALEEAQAACERNAAHVRLLRTRLAEGLSALGDVRVLGSDDPCRMAPGIVCACFKGLDRETLLVLLDQAGICASAGSACSAGAVERSHVLQAMRVPQEWSRGAIRFSLGPDNTAQEIEETLAAMEGIVTHLRERRMQ
ncbi:MAG: cysteine desulfurase family protein [Eggerthellaceae bacterium]|jgi:cysteine desulfurase